MAYRVRFSFEHLALKVIFHFCPFVVPVTKSRQRESEEGDERPNAFPDCLLKFLSKRPTAVLTWWDCPSIKSLAWREGVTLTVIGGGLRASKRLSPSHLADFKKVGCTCRVEPWSWAVGD